MALNMGCWLRIQLGEGEAWLIEIYFEEDHSSMLGA